MGTNLYWEPVERKQNSVGGDDGLKWALRKKYGERLDVELTSRSLEYLEGLRDAGQENAQALIDAIEKHDAIRVFEE